MYDIGWVQNNSFRNNSTVFKFRKIHEAIEINKFQLCNPRHRKQNKHSYVIGPVELKL